MDVPKNLKYTEDHEWALLKNDIAVIGITYYAQHELGDIVYVELPSVGSSFSKGDALGTIEAVKTVADVYAPLSGEVVEVNEALQDASELLNKDPYGEGWIVKLKLADPAEVADLIAPEAYEKLIG
jgi:glycine cleavage system H protein